MNRILTVSVLAASVAASAALAIAHEGQTGPPAPGGPQAQPAPAPAAAAPQADAQAMAKALSNPVASLISFPFQGNWDFGVGPEEGQRFVLNVQPVMPFSLNDDWTLIARVITPLVAQPVLFEGSEPSFGMGDLLPSFFVSPKVSQTIWGVGPVFSLPVTSDPTLGSGKWSLGPTAVVLKQFGPWTTGALVNHLWSVGGDEDRRNVNQTFLQPFLSYATQTGYAFTLNMETTANWEAEDGETWTVPINLLVAKVTRLGRRPIQVFAGVRYYAEKPSGGPDWGIRLGMTLIFPLMAPPAAAPAR